MASTSAKMFLRLWDQLSDLYSHDLLAKNFRKIDAHDHTLGRGNQVPTGGFVDGAVTFEKLAPGAGDTNWKKIKSGTNGVDGTYPAGTYPMSDRPVAANDVSGVFYFNPSDWGVSAGQLDKMKLTSVITVYSPGTGVTLSQGLYPAIVEYGTVSFGPRVGDGTTFTNLAFDGQFRTATIEIPVPPEGLYVLAVNFNSPNNTSSRTHLMVKR